MTQEKMEALRPVFLCACKCKNIYIYIRSKCTGTISFSSVFNPCPYMYTHFFPPGHLKALPSYIYIYKLKLNKNHHSQSWIPTLNKIPPYKPHLFPALLMRLLEQLEAQRGQKGWSEEQRKHINIYGCIDKYIYIYLEKIYIQICIYQYIYICIHTNVNGVKNHLGKHVDIFTCTKYIQSTSFVCQNHITADSLWKEHLLALT